MLIKFGEYEPSSRPKKAIFMCVISLYFSSFFIDHPVDVIQIVFFATPSVIIFCEKQQSLIRTLDEDPTTG